MRRNVKSKAPEQGASESNSGLAKAGENLHEAAHAGPRNVARRQIAGRLAVGGAAAAIWHKPIVETLVLPAHAQATDFIVEPPASCVRLERYAYEIPVRDANWSLPLFVPRYNNPELSLRQVLVQWFTQVEGDIQIENLEDPDGDVVDVNVGATVGAKVVLIGPDGKVIGDAEPSVSRDATVTGFDEIIDFGGTSGVSFEGVTFQQVNERRFNDAETLAYFVGTGRAQFTANSFGASSAFGSANMVTRISTRSGMLLRVTYSCN